MMANGLQGLLPSFGIRTDQPMVWNGPYVPSDEPKRVGNIPAGAVEVARGLIG
jgi:hypothetical protein